ncbi:hypothetical protein E4L95_03465 [Paracoccus liaowanqingii]|uniref:Uncharacterized protein n=1 Tax=Paracoccus liaowanqingii TaxID=2560053 RepID=A0A4Z1CRX0_9RHOB|nr:hypothetical protein [Paracoccus liaowanqingii]TGN67883.1 hypothetical protein E4L95_03465 [Paracoccus liaowanqingii]
MTSAWFVWPSLFALAITLIWVWAALRYNSAPPPGQSIAVDLAVFQGMGPAAGGTLATIAAIVPIIMVEKVHSDPISLALLSVIAFLSLIDTALGFWLREAIRTLPRNSDQKALVQSRLHITVRAAMIGIFFSIIILLMVFFLFSPFIIAALEPATSPSPDGAGETTVAPESGNASSGTSQEQAPKTGAAPPPVGAGPGDSETTAPKS